MAHTLSIIQSSTLTARYRRPFLGLFKLLILVQTLLKPMCNLAPLCILSYCTTFRYEEIVHQTWWGKGDVGERNYFECSAAVITQFYLRHWLARWLQHRFRSSTRSETFSTASNFSKEQNECTITITITITSPLCVLLSDLMFITSRRHPITTRSHIDLLIPWREATLVHQWTNGRNPYSR